MTPSAAVSNSKSKVGTVVAGTELHGETTQSFEPVFWAFAVVDGEFSQPEK